MRRAEAEARAHRPRGGGLVPQGDAPGWRPGRRPARSQRRLRRLLAPLAALLAAATLPGAAAAQDGKAVLIVDTPSGINRFVRAAHALRAEEAREGATPTRWILRTTRQVDAAPEDSLRAWARAADRALVRLAVGGVASRLGEALEGGGGTLWVYQSDPALVARSRSRGRAFLAGADPAWTQRAAEGKEPASDSASAELRAWRRGLDFLNGRGEENARLALRLLAETDRAGAERALRSAPPVAGGELPERYPLPETLPPSAPAVGILDFDSYALNSEAEVIDSVASALARRGIRPVAVVARWGEPTVAAMRRHFLHPDGTPAVEAVISLQSFLLGGDAARSEADSLLSRMAVPLFRAIRLTGVDPDAWAASGEGIPWAAVYHQVAMPELQGAIEPVVVAAEAVAAVDPLTGARRAVYAPIPEQVELLARRVERWTRLRSTPPAEKQVALVYYNHPPGKQNIGADNLNVTASLVRLLELLRGAGYDLGAVGEMPWTRNPDSLAAVLVRRGINTGAFGEGQLEQLADEGALLLPADRYASWFAALPRLVRREVEDGPLGYLEALLEEHEDGLAAAPRRPDAEEAARLARAEARLRAETELVFGQMRDFFSAFEAEGPERARGPEVLDEVERGALAALAGGSLESFRTAKRRFLALEIEALSGWGPAPGRVMTVERGGERYLVIPGVRLGNVFLGPQPQRGFHADPEKVHASTLVAPPHQYLAFYAYLAHELGADALVHVGRHSSYEWLPRKQVGLSHADHPVALLHDLPSIYLYTVDGVGEGLQAKRRGLATLVDHLTPPLRAAPLYGEMLELQGMHDSYHAQKAPERRREIAERIRARLAEPRMADLRAEMEAENGGRAVETFDDELLVHEVGHELGALRETMMPFGLHTFATAWTGEEERMLAASMVALQVDSSDVAARDSAQAEIVRLLRRSATAEGDAFLAALAGRRVEPGPGNDPIRTPAVLPTGRNFHALDASLIPTALGADLGRALAERSLEALRRERADPAYTPERVSAVLWAVETTRDEGAMVGFALHLMGMEPVWDARGKVKGLRVIPADSLGRPRVDVTLVTSGLFRDLFTPALHLLDEGFRRVLAASAGELAERRPELLPALRGALQGVPREEWGREPLEGNRLALHWATEATTEMTRAPDPEAAGRRALARIFGPSMGNYGAGVNYLVSQPDTWRDRSNVADHYLDRMQYAYGAGAWGAATGSGLEEKLRGVEAAFHSRSSNLYGVADNDDFFDYFGGLSLAAERVNGAAPESFVLHSADPRRTRAERLQTFLGRELRARYYNPEWIRGQMGEGYDGARTISNKFVEFLWGWQVTNPDVVRDWMWEEVQDVYLEDKHGLGVARWMAEGDRGYAMQNTAAILLTAARRGFWRASDQRLGRIADRLGELVVAQGAACSAHVCADDEALAFAERHMDPALRTDFRAAVAAARGVAGPVYAAPTRRPVPGRAEVASPLPEPVPHAEPRADAPAGVRPEAPAPAPARSSAPTAATERPAEAAPRVREVVARAREMAGSPWGWGAGLGLGALLLAFGAGVARGRSGRA